MTPEKAKLIYPSGVDIIKRVSPHNSKRMESEECGTFNVLKIGNLYIYVH